MLKFSLATSNQKKFTIATTTHYICALKILQMIEKN